MTYEYECIYISKQTDVDVGFIVEFDPSEHLRYLLRSEPSDIVHQTFLVEFPSNKRAGSIDACTVKHLMSIY